MPECAVLQENLFSGLPKRSDKSKPVYLQNLVGYLKFQIREII